MAIQSKTHGGCVRGKLDTFLPVQIFGLYGRRAGV